MFNKYPKYKSQVLAKTCPTRSTTSWNKEQWKKLTELAEWQYRKYCTSDAKKALVGITEWQYRKYHFSFFVWFFWYFSQHKDHKRRNHKNFHLQQRWDVAYRKSARSLKSVQEPWQFFFFIFLNFFGNFNETKQAYRQVWVTSKWGRQAPVKISDFSDKRAKSYACFTEGTSSYGLLRLNSADRAAATRVNARWRRKGCGAGRRLKAARNLSRASAARIHTRRLARASRLMGWIDLWSR